jgi:type III secretory pathway component EscV
VEEAFVRLRPPRIELRAHPVYLRTIVAGDPLEEPLSVYAERVDGGFRDGLRSLERELLVELGLRLPDLECVPRRSLPAGMIVIRINDRSGPPTMGVSSDEVLVRAPVDALSAANIRARPAANPAVDGHLSVAASAERQRLERLGLACWSFPEVLGLTLAGEIRRRAYLLLDMEEVEYQLGQLEEVFPGLVEAALTRISLGDLTRILRGLLREGVSIRDLKTILERLVQYDSVPADPHGYLVLDERLPLADRSAGADWRHRLEFVRSGLRSQLSERYARGRDRLDVYRVNPRLERLAKGERDEELQEAARDALWAHAARFAGAPHPPVIYTTNGARAAVRELLAPEFPDLPVVSAAELRRDIAVHPLGEIGVAVPSMRFARRG